VFEEDKKKKKIYDKKSAKAKAENYCAYQERSQQEVRDKLYEWGLHSKEVEEVISELIVDNYLNEERFAIAYALGKFRIKKWGKVKIKQGLKLKKVSDYCIKKAMNAIDPDDYEQTLKEVIAKKNTLTNEKNEFKRKSQLAAYAISRGFESELVYSLIAIS
jgi:regulatory protein